MLGKPHTIHRGDGETCDGLAIYPEGNRNTFSRLHEMTKNEIKWRQFCKSDLQAWKGVKIESNNISLQISRKDLSKLKMEPTT